MKKFLDENFLLENKIAEELFHDYAKLLPIIDYHCHLNPAEIANNISFKNLTQVWLYGDHYKWRAMRTNGIDEYYCTGDAGDYEKFMKWAETVPQTLRNPLYHWTHLELQRYFNIHEVLNPNSAQYIYDRSKELLAGADYKARGIVERMNVELFCTTDDPLDNLEYHQQVAAEKWKVKMLPAWRPDKAMMVENASFFNQYIDQLEIVSGISIRTYDSLMEALLLRHDYFHQHSCRLSDHGLSTFYSQDYTHSEISAIFDKVRCGKELGDLEVVKFKSAMLYEFAVMDASKAWVQQFHVGPLRNNNSRMFALKGADIGFDSIGDEPVAKAMSKFFARLDKEGKLAKTIIYNLNPADNEVYATMIGNFQDGITPGKIQWGSGWWFLDQKDGMEKHLNTLSNLGLLSRFVGMLTDSRSLMSYPRHEYFRRILCNMIGKDVMKGEIPYDIKHLGNMISNICYQNALEYFTIK